MIHNQKRTHLSMAYQYVREPLKSDEADRLAHACQNTKEKLTIWTLLDTGLRVSELCGLTSDNILWQQRSLRISGKGGPYGSKTKKRVVPMSKRVQALLEPYFALNDSWFVGERQIQKLVKNVANRAQISSTVTPHVLRHTFATLALQKGISLAAVQKMLGHDRLATTEIYLNLTEGHGIEEFQNKW
ncbi:tyrosine-type recombinase/integrase [Rhodopirellula bahusiensis]|uniref:tyrosine-type recombinase/integrase n=1 Tax=Rhodopirellula bahusiensis TaxID=2014065 RepID=UPI0032984194